MTPQLRLGPLLRYAGETDATVWVETDSACEVEVLGRRSRTFEIEGHHYALLRITKLEPGETYEYEVHLDGQKVWPEAEGDFPPSVIRTISPDGAFNLYYGSCRVSAPHDPPHTLAAVFGASFGFMMPVSTPQNAVVYGSGMIPITKMVRSGIFFDVIGLALIVLLIPIMAGIFLAG